MPWFDMKCTVCPNRDEILLDEAPEDGKSLGACTLEEGACPGVMVRAWTAPAIGRGSSGEPFRGTSPTASGLL